MVLISLFDKKATAAAEKNYTKRKLEDKERRGFAMVAQFLCQYVQVSETAMCEMIAKVNPEWEPAAKKLVQEKGPEAKFEGMADLFNRVGRELQKILVNSADASKVETGMKNAFQTWKSKNS